MTMHAQDTSVRHELVVEAPIERAFSVFTEDFDRIKPREHNLLAVDVAETVFERREGGRIYQARLEGLAELRAELDTYWTEALHSSKQVAEDSYRAAKEQA